jgi:hypothetical protein
MGSKPVSGSAFERLFDELNRAGARYVAVGGFATVLHGYARLTADVDLIVDLDPTAARVAIEALTRLGLRPRAPVDPLEFADARVRQRWIEDKGMRVFSFWDPSDPLLEVDLSVEPPIAFDELWRRSEVFELGATLVRIAAIPDLIAMKRLAGRIQDLQDIEALEAILKERRG